MISGDLHPGDAQAAARAVVVDVPSAHLAENAFGLRTELLRREQVGDAHDRALGLADRARRTKSKARAQRGVYQGRPLHPRQSINVDISGSF